MQDQRKEQRWPAYVGGAALFFNGTSTASVLIRNKSDSGAKLLVYGSDFVPDEFKLNVPCWGREFRVKARWRRHDLIGIEFC